MADLWQEVDHDEDILERYVARIRDQAASRERAQATSSSRCRFMGKP
jgi:hypothetical protein